MDPSTSSIAHKQRTQRTLPDLMATLPQELYDQIYDEVITTESRAVVVTLSKRRSYSPPAGNLLDVTRHMREQVLKSYYANTIFVIREGTRLLLQSIPWLDLARDDLQVMIYKYPGRSKTFGWGFTFRGVLKEYECGSKVYKALKKEGIKLIFDD
ncbi:hypothetical protein HII31_00883 [Pseudocercospora fuligena]|uniref:Uncharacterized protein n=1 Tax=Pseudocercospora fuligena TaxID=685502 RepID=A0A8H6RV48_9PEZI|nr:hypothetical protein HII31_00883 [Pseudocercospora fuligena]